MSEFTYEKEESASSLETYEWDNVWWEHTENTEAPRALLIGDSISCGYRRILNQRLNGRILVDAFGTSKAVDNPYFIPSLRLFLSQMRHCDLIALNNGLHGWHLSDAEYARHYRRMIETLRAEYPQKKWLIVLTTPVRNTADLNRLDDRNARVLARNEAVCALAQEGRIPVVDAYTALCDRPQLWQPDGVHLKEEGYAILAALCAHHMDKALQL